MNNLLPLHPDASVACNESSKPSPLVVDAKALAVLLSAGLRTVRAWHAGGRLPAPVKIGGRVIWRVSEIESWLAAGAPNRERWEAIKAVRMKT